MRSARLMPRRLDGLLDLAGFEAARADVGARGLALEQDADALEVRVEAALRGDHRMAPVVTEAGLLPANGADLGHPGRDGSGSGLEALSGLVPWRGAARRRRPSRGPSVPPRRPCPPGPWPARACPR